MPFDFNFQVLRLKLNGDELHSLEEVFVQSGGPDDIYLSTVAMYKHNSMLIGSLHHRLTFCEVKYLQ